MKGPAALRGSLISVDRRLPTSWPSASVIVSLDWPCSHYAGSREGFNVGALGKGRPRTSLTARPVSWISQSFRPLSKR